MAQTDHAAALGHLVLAEIGLPAKHSFLDLLEIGLYGRNALVGRILHQVLKAYAALGKFFLLEVDENGTVNIAGSILDKYLSFVFRIADDIPGTGLFSRDYLGIVDDARSTPHIRN